MDILLAQTSILFATLIITIIFTIVNLRMSERNRIYDNISDLFSLRNQRENITTKLQSNPLDSSNVEDRKYFRELANIQLQMKHVLFDIEDRKSIKLNASQYRLLAECCEDLLYISKALNYWEKALNSTFPDPIIRSEYYRHYGEFLYRRDLFLEGDNSFEEALKLEAALNPRILIKQDEIRYIHFKTCESWILSIENTMDRSISISTNQREIIEKENKIKDIEFRMYILATAIKSKDMQRNCIGILSKRCDISTLSPSNTHN